MIDRRRGFLALVMLTCSTLSAFAPARADEPIRLRILSYNIRHGEGMDSKVDLERIAGVIRALEPDLVALQEVDRGCKRTNGLDEPAELGRLTGMKPLFARNIPYQGGEYGNAVLTRLPVTAWRNERHPSRHVGEQRGFLVVDVTAPDARKTPFRFMATHIDSRPDDAERMDSVKAIEKVARERPDLPAILAGDLNSKPDSRVLAAFTENWTRTDSSPLLTFPADRPDRQIDYVLVRPAGRWKVLETRVIAEPTASDHRPLLSVLELAGH
ncbi:endonuclease/exonuclease/phosphatase family protein [Aquisphaera insulae]|uniref:endonuclease/exonuclease/phosphatase family protein n=1 Tax=Aquisphaera insulae TaxID=2712864 RepID=UPI00202EA5D7|nr:endonuclease/exonuclease/phosphatase family protein [Aquisphaera insulae]